MPIPGSHVKHGKPAPFTRPGIDLDAHRRAPRAWHDDVRIEDLAKGDTAIDIGTVEKVVRMGELVGVKNIVGETTVVPVGTLYRAFTVVKP